MARRRPQRSLNRLRAALDRGVLADAVKRGLLSSERSRDVYPSLGELSRRYRESGAGTPRGLTGFELRVFSENGEDGVIAEILGRIGVADRVFVEFGAGDGHECNTAFLADVLGWTGTYFEPDRGAFGVLARRHRHNPRVRIVNAAITAENIDARFAAAGVPPAPDVVSIDVDGNDYWIWRALTMHRPRLVVVEYNGGLDLREPLVMPYQPDFRWDHTAAYGASLAALEQLAEAKGYRLVHTDAAGVNAFFVRADLSDGLPRADEVARHAVNLHLAGMEHPPSRDAPAWIRPR